MIIDGAFILYACIPRGKPLSLVPRSRLSASESTNGETAVVCGCLSIFYGNCLTLFHTILTFNDPIEGGF